MPNTHVRVAVRSCRLCATVSPCKSQQSITSQSALVIYRHMQRITLFTFCLPVEPRAKKAKTLVNFFDFSPPKTQFSNSDLSEEIADYLKDDESDPAKLWSQTKRMNTRLGELARRTFCVPATSASSERVFSKSGILMSPLMSRMSSKTLEMRTFLKRNYGFVDNHAPVTKTVEISSKQ